MARCYYSRDSTRSKKTGICFFLENSSSSFLNTLSIELENHKRIHKSRKSHEVINIPNMTELLYPTPDYEDKNTWALKKGMMRRPIKSTPPSDCHIFSQILPVSMLHILNKIVQLYYTCFHIQVCMRLARNFKAFLVTAIFTKHSASTLGQGVNLKRMIFSQHKSHVNAKFSLCKVREGPDCSWCKTVSGSF